MIDCYDTFDLLTLAADRRRWPRLSPGHKPQGLPFGGLIQSRQSLAGSAVVSPQGGLLVLLQDTFTDATNTALTSHTMDRGPGWTAQAGTLKINASNQCAVNALGGGEAVATSDSGHGDLTASVDITAGTAADDMLLFRFQDNNNYWAADVSSGSNLLVIYEKATTFNIKASTALTVNAGTTYHVVVQAKGNQITVSVGGTSVSFTSITGGLSRTLCGIRANAANTVFDNFLVTSP